MKAIILSAGLGTRLRPLTLKTPKALLLVRNSPLIVYTLRLLRGHGITEVVINLHHLGDLIKKELGDGRRFGMRIHYSHEKEILGTGGGIKRAAGFFPNEPLLVANSDILIDVDLKKLIRFHRKKRGIATMVIRPRDPSSNFSSIQLGENDRIVGIEDAASEGNLMYTGVQVVEPRLLEYLPTGNSCIVRQGYCSALAAGEKIYGFRYDGYWDDLGTLERYRLAERNLTSGKVSLSFLEQSSPTRRGARRR